MSVTLRVRTRVSTLATVDGAMVKGRFRGQNVVAVTRFSESVPHGARKAGGRHAPWRRIVPQRRVGGGWADQTMIYDNAPGQALTDGKIKTKTKTKNHDDDD